MLQTLEGGKILLIRLPFLPPCLYKKNRCLVCSFRLGNGISSLEFSNDITKIKENLKMLKRVFQLIHKTVRSSVSRYILAVVSVGSRS